VLARENSIAEIERIQQAQAEAGGSPLPLEVFVHGALCVAYSGQCLTSEALGGRSANRGECAQACRLPYDLYADGQKVDLGDRRYLLSPQDLAGLEVLPDLVRAGVASLKIEGRLKSPEYVASITRVYRQALDRTMAAFTAGDPTATPAPATVPTTPAAERYELEMSFSRGLYTGWFRGIDNQHLAHGRFGTKRGVYLGDVIRVTGDEVVLRLQAPLKPGDGVVFDAGNPEQREEGGRVYHVISRGADTVLRFGQGNVDFRRVHPGNKVWKTSDPALEREVRTTFEGEKVRHTRPVRAEVHGHAGGPLTLLLDDGHGHVVRVDSAVPLAAAEQQPLDTERLRAQVGRLGGTPFHLSDLVNHLEGAVILPVSELNRLRRDAVAVLARGRHGLRSQPGRRPVPRCRCADTG
jgi:putative protease